MVRSQNKKKIMQKSYVVCPTYGKNYPKNKKFITWKLEEKNREDKKKA